MDSGVRRAIFADSTQYRAKTPINVYLRAFTEFRLGAVEKGRASLGLAKVNPTFEV
jgi:hypothetical protein